MRTLSSADQPPRPLLFAAIVALSIAAPFAEGALKQGWIAVILLLPVALYVSRPSLRARLSSLLIVILTSCAMLTLVDLLLRVTLGAELNPVATNNYTRKLPIFPLLGRWDAEVHSTTTGYGDLAALLPRRSELRESRRVTLQTDASGFRNASIPASIDVVVLGDSFAAGYGTSQEDTFSEVLRRDYGLSTYNLGFPGSPWQEYINFLMEAPRLPLAPRAHLIWTIFTGNDLDDLTDGYQDRWSVEELPLNSALRRLHVGYRTFSGRSPIRQLTDGLLHSFNSRPTLSVSERPLPNGQSILFMDIQEERATQTVEQVRAHPNFTKLENTFAAMRRAVAARNMALTILLLPTKGAVYPWILASQPTPPTAPTVAGFIQAAGVLCAQLQLRCLDATPWLYQRAVGMAWDKGRLLWWRDDTHPNPQGHQALADFIAQEVLHVTKR